MALPVQRYTQYKSNPTSSDGNQHWDASPVDGFPWLFIGSLSAAEDHHHLQENNIKRILTVARRLSVVVPDFILEHCVVEVDDHPGANFLDSAAQQCKDFIDTAQTAASSLNSGTEEGGEEHHTTSEHSSSFPPPCVLVHCASGISRSASAIITWLMDPRRGLTLNDALAAIRTNRPAIHPNIGFMMQMQILEKHGGNLTNAVAEWNDKTHTDIYERVSSRRHKANDIHAAADELEVIMQKNSVINLSLQNIISC